MFIIQQNSFKQLPKFTPLISAIQRRGYQKELHTSPGLNLLSSSFDRSIRAAVTITPSRFMSTATTKSERIKPSGLEDSVSDISFKIMKQVSGENVKDQVQFFLKKTEESFESNSPADIAEMRHFLNGMSDDEYLHFQHALGIHSFAIQEDQKNGYVTLSTVPFLESLETLISTAGSVHNALKALTRGGQNRLDLEDILTIHPVVPDKDAVVQRQQLIRDERHYWKHEKQSFNHATTDYSISRYREIMDRSLTTIEDAFRGLYADNPGQRERKVTPNQEMRNMNRNVERSLRGLIDAQRFIRQIYKEAMLKGLAKELLSSNRLFPQDKQDLATLLTLPRGAEQVSLLESSPIVKAHPDYDLIISAMPRFRIGSWRGDGDGHEGITEVTVAKADADGRSRFFSFPDKERHILDGDSAKISPKILLKMKKRLDSIRDQAERYPRLMNYINAKEADGWSIVKLYSGLMVKRADIAVEAAKNLIDSDSTNLLSAKHPEGFRNSEEFEFLAAPLKEYELSLGLKDGYWTRRIEESEMVGINYSKRTQSRKGQEFHEAVLDEIIGFSNKSPINQIGDMLRFLHTPDQNPRHTFESLTNPQNKKVFGHLFNAGSVVPDMDIIQSDSAQDGDILKSILILCCMRHATQLTSDVVILCEHEQSMIAGIEFFENFKASESIKDYLLRQGHSEESLAPYDDVTTITMGELTKNVIAQSAGSDNQTRQKAPKSHQRNRHYLTAAANAGIRTFLGQGCGPLRSSLLNTSVPMRTVQPGSRREMLGSKASTSLISHFATVVQEIARELDNEALSPAVKEKRKTIYRLFGEHVHACADKAIEDNEDAFKAKLVTFLDIDSFGQSRAAKKKPGNPLETSRAIDKAKGQVAINSLDIQAGYFLEATVRTLADCKDLGYSEHDIHDAFSKKSDGEDIITTFIKIAELIDDGLLDSSICTTSKADIEAAIEMLTGSETKISDNKVKALRGLRIMYQESSNRPITCKQISKDLLGSANIV